MSSTNGAASPQAAATSPTRRHQIKRSLSEFTSPGKSSRARKDRLANGSQHEESSSAVPGSSRHLRTPSLAPGGRGVDARMSLDMPRSNNFSPAMSPEQSRRGSVLIPPAAPPPAPLARETRDKEEGPRASSTESGSNNARLRQNQARIAGNTEYVV